MKLFLFCCILNLFHSRNMVILRKKESFTAFHMEQNVNNNLAFQADSWMFSDDISSSVLWRCVSGDAQAWFTYITQQQSDASFKVLMSCASSCSSPQQKNRNIFWQGRRITHLMTYSLYYHACVSDWAVSVYLGAELQVYKCVNVRVVDCLPALQLWGW